MVFVQVNIPYTWLDQVHMAQRHDTKSTHRPRVQENQLFINILLKHPYWYLSHRKTYQNVGERVEIEPQS